MYSRNAEKRDYRQLWTHTGNKFVIGTLHGTHVEIAAQYNPKELARQATATWTPNPNTSAKQSKTSESKSWSQYTSTAPRTVTLELVFDGYEENISIAPLVEALENLTIPVDLKSRIASERRPQLCVAVWGSQSLRCVVQSVATKLTMFDSSGEPLRATCNVVLQEVDVVQMMKVDNDGSDFLAFEKRVRTSSGSEKHVVRGNDPVPPPSSSKASPTTTAPAASKPAPKPAEPAPAPAPKPADPALVNNTLDAKTEQAPSTPEPEPSEDANDASTPAQHPTVVTPEGTYAVGTPTSDIDPNAIEGNDGGTDEPFKDKHPTVVTPEGTYATGTPTSDVDPNAVEGMDGATDEPFKDKKPPVDAVSSADAPAGSGGDPAKPAPDPEKLAASRAAAEDAE